MNTSSQQSGHGASGARIATQLRDAILDGAYAPGTRIRQEDLADRLGGSRAPVRDALRILEAEGLITRVANAGAWVSRLSLPECEELYQVRENLEPLLIRRNLPLLDERAADLLDELAGQMERAVDAEEFLLLDRQFHFSTYGATETLILHDTVSRLWNRTHHYRRAFVRVARSQGSEDIHHDHRLIASSVRRGDAEEAARVLHLHIRRTRLELARHPEIFDH